MSLTLFGLPVSPFVSRVMLVAQIKGIDLPVVMPDIDEAFGRFQQRISILQRDPSTQLDPLQFMIDTPFMRDVNPQGRIPVLDIDGRYLAESFAICEYLDEVHPEPPLLPGDAYDRAKVRQLCCMCDLSLSAQLWPLAGQIDPIVKDAARLRTIKAELERSLLELERSLGAGPWAWGNAMSIADVLMLYTILFYQCTLETTTENLGIVTFDRLEPFPEYPRLRAWWTHLERDACFGAAIERYRGHYAEMFTPIVPDRSPLAYGIWFRARAPRT